MAEYEEDVVNNYNKYDTTIAAMDLTAAEAAELSSMEGVLCVEENITLTGSQEAAPDGIKYSIIPGESGESEVLIFEDDSEQKQWYLDAIGLTDGVGNISRDDIKVELLDSGVSDTDDIEVKQRVNLIPGEEYVSPLYDYGNGHGTGLAGIICASDNGEGITGINPNVSLYSVKALDSGNTGLLSRVIDGIYWGIENDMDIINMSLGTTVNSTALHEAVKDAHEAGILLIAAGGNEEHKEVQYPAAYEEVIAVGGTSTDGKLIEDFAMGTELEMLAPGDKIVTTGLFDGTLTAAGTSISTAEVTAAASILWGIDKTKPADFIRELLTATGRTVENSSSNGYGAKLIDVSRAIEVYDEFAMEYGKESSVYSAAVLNNEEAQSFEDVTIVNGLWKSDTHVSIIDNYLNSSDNIGIDAFKKLNENRVSIMGTMAKAADTLYGKDEDAGTSSSALHGTGNYKKGLKYLYYCAEGVRNKNNSVSQASNAAYAKIVGDGTELDMVNSLKMYTEDMLNKNIPGISSDQTNAAVRYFKVLGFALHCLQDTFAHRAVIQPDELSFFSSSDFTTQMWSSFKSGVNAKTIEYRDVYTYTNENVLSPHQSKIKYEDNSSVGNTRFKDAKKQSAYMLKGSLLQTSYMSTWFTAPKYETELEKANGTNAYKE